MNDHNRADPDGPCCDVCYTPGPCDEHGNCGCHHNYRAAVKEKAPPEDPRLPCPGCQAHRSFCRCRHRNKAPDQAKKKPTTATVPGAVVVTVVDRLRYTGAVTCAQAAAYVRKLVPDWEESESGYKGEPACHRRFREPEAIAEAAHRPPRRIDMPIQDDYGDTAERMAECCDKIVEYGFCDKPSDVLRAIAAEVT